MLAEQSSFYLRLLIRRLLVLSRIALDTHISSSCRAFILQSAVISDIRTVALFLAYIPLHRSSNTTIARSF